MIIFLKFELNIKFNEKIYKQKKEIGTIELPGCNRGHSWEN